MKEKTAASTAGNRRPALKQPGAFVLALIILVAVGGVVAWQKRGPKLLDADQTAEKTENVPDSKPVEGEVEFIQQMIPHHQEAIDSSKYMLENSESEELKKFAETVITDQSKEIWTMIGFYQIWNKKPYPGAPKYMKMMPDLTQLSGRALDKAYIEGMIQHHQMAVESAQKILKVTQKEELKTVASNIIDNQKKEITTLNGWLKDYQTN